MRPRSIGRAAVLAAASLLAGCDTVGYYAQAVGGQAELLAARRPIDDVIADPHAPARLRERLEEVRRIRAYASAELGLPDNGSYRAYADLGRRYVVWNVFATEPLSMEPLRWCFPIAGCVSYRGYFDQAQAQAFGEALVRSGHDVFVSGVPAYSTLGWFDDPVINTFVHYPRPELARLIFHELAHQQLYVKDDSTFNESFAVAVERAGVRRWLARYGTPEEREAFARSQQRREDFYATVRRFRDRLAALYAEDIPPERKREAKRRVFADLGVEYAALRTSWGGFRGYDRWLGETANNATLAAVAVYTQRVPAFERMLEQAGGDLRRFLADAAALAARPREERDAVLSALSRADAADAGDAPRPDRVGSSAPAGERVRGAATAPAE